MDKFIQYLEKKRIANSKTRSFYALWVRNLYHYIRKRPGEPLKDDEIRHFLASIAETHHDWQVQQANQSIQLYLHYQRQPATTYKNTPSGVDRLWCGAIDQMVSIMRLKHMSYRTEQTYISWMRQFYRNVSGVSPEYLTSDHVINFLTHLAVNRKVSKSTQNQAFNALLFFFRHVLKKDIDNLWKSLRVKKRQRLPVVLSATEVQRLLDNVQGLQGLMLQVIYGGGLRLAECLRLRVKDLDFERGCLVIRASKGDKDRVTLLPEALVLPLT